MLDSIPDDIADLLPEDIFSNNSDDIGSGAQQITNWNFIIDFIFNCIGMNFKTIIKVFATLMALLILCSLLNTFNTTVKNSAVDGVVGIVGNIAVMSSIMEISNEPITKALSMLDNLKIFVNTISPALSAMYAMGGNVNSAIIHNYGLIVFLSVLENICIISLELIVGICMALTLASAFVKEGNLLALSNAIKKIFSFILGFIMLTFTTVISTQSLLASKADNLSSKTAKMLVSQIIPLIGGSIGESLRTAGASIEYLRSNIGVILIVVLLLMIIPTLINIALYRLVFILTNSFAGLLGCNREGNIILEISSIFGYILAIISICSIVLILLLTVFAKCASPLS
ncbi:MAG: hypothetical protein J6S23_01955 [Clostridia bacterium]|nr:hypothetical protein [Clostridia bacterium]